jgi:ABC-type nitrate/sulfonate/bicarbonate transport system permease component
MTIGRRVAIWSLRLGVIVVLLGVWIWSNRPGGVSKLLLPDLGSVVSNFGALLVSPEFWQAALLTVAEILAAFVVSAPLGVLVGFFAARTAVRTGVIGRVALWGYMAPLILFYPLFLLWFNVGPLSKIAFAGVSIFFPVLYGAIRAFRSVDGKYLRVARAFAASPAQADWLIKFRAALPMLSSTLRIAAALSAITVIFTEMLASQGGLGYLLASASQSFAVARAFALITAILIFVGLIQLAINSALAFDRHVRT